MPKMGFRADGDENVYVYLESKDGSSSIGLDSADDQRLKISVSPSIDSNPDESPMGIFDPRQDSTSGSGDITLIPKLQTSGVNAGDSGDCIITLTGTTAHFTVSNLSTGVVQSNNLGEFSSSNGSNGQILIGGGSAPTWATITAGTGMSVVNAANSITLNASATTPISFPTDSGTATPAANALTITGAGGITTSGSGATVTITGSGAAFTWNDVTGTSANMNVNNGYSANNAGLVTLTLPGTAAFGSIIEVTSGVSGTGLWRIAQPAGVTVHFGNQNTTTGVGGYLEATAQYDGVRLLCHKANTDWVVLPGTQGNITVV